MKFIRTVEAETAQQKYWAALNAETTNIANKSHFSAQAQLKLERAEQVLGMLHYDSKTKLNYRKTLASIKVFNRNIQDVAKYDDYVEYLTEMGFERKASKQGIIYAIKKSKLAA